MAVYETAQQQNNLTSKDKVSQCPCLILSESASQQVLDNFTNER